jgi:hypothetical protein
MKSVFVILAVTFLIIADSQATQAKDYIYCRGGGPLKATYSVVPIVPSGKQDLVDMKWQRSYSIDFARAAKSAVTEPPPPGHCTLAGRPIRNDEPGRLRASWTDKQPSLRNKPYPGQWIQQLVMTPGTMKVRSVRGDDLKFLIDGIYSSHTVFSVEVLKKTEHWQYKKIGKVFRVDQWPPREVMPDLLIKKIKRLTGTPKVGQPVQFAVTVKNNGASVAPAYRLILRIGGGRQLAEKRATRLGPDREATYTVVLPPRQAAQRYRLVVQVVPGPRAHELSTGNNQKSYDFEVRP